MQWTYKWGRDTLSEEREREERDSTGGERQRERERERVGSHIG